jgi:hypothetical protein
MGPFASPRLSRRLFRWASIGHILVAVAHFNGQFLSRWVGPPPPPAEVELMKHMTSIGGEMLGLRFSAAGVLDSLGLFYSVFSAFAGLQNLLLLRLLDDAAPVPRGFAWANAALCGVLGALALAFGLAPPLLCYAVLLPLFALSALAGPAAPAAPGDDAGEGAGEGAEDDAEA